MIIVSKIYSIGTGAGQPPAGDRLTDSLIGFAKVASITLNSQNYNQDLQQDGDCLIFTPITTQNDDFLTVNFEHAIVITN